MEQLPIIVLAVPFLQTVQRISWLQLVRFIVPIQEDDSLQITIQTREILHEDKHARVMPRSSSSRLYLNMSAVDETRVLTK